MTELTAREVVLRADKRADAFIGALLGYEVLEVRERASKVIKVADGKRYMLHRPDGLPYSDVAVPYAWTRALGWEPIPNFTGSLDIAAGIILRELKYSPTPYIGIIGKPDAGYTCSLHIQWVPTESIAPTPALALCSAYVKFLEGKAILPDKQRALHLTLADIIKDFADVDTE